MIDDASLLRRNVKPWQDEHLEFVKQCPVCNAEKSKPLVSDLVDDSFDEPIGLWNMVQCVSCEVAYLSPRADKASIKLAYKGYYTHTSKKDKLIKGYIRDFINYISKSYYLVSNQSGQSIDFIIYYLLKLLFPISAYMDAKSRHLFVSSKKKGKLLDIGCGNGEFLAFAKKFGWDVSGVDFDEIAVEEAKTKGLDVRLSNSDVINSDEKYDFISLSHVIEHVYDPVLLIKTCHSMLNKNGVLWMETPNIKSFGYALYGRNWRGLEPPRHLVLFNTQTLKKVLSESGFSSVKQKYHGLSGVYMVLASEQLLSKTQTSKSSLHAIFRSCVKYSRLIVLEFLQIFSKKRRDFITLIAVK